MKTEATNLDPAVVRFLENAVEMGGGVANQLLEQGYLGDGKYKQKNKTEVDQRGSIDDLLVLGEDGKVIRTKIKH